MVLKIKVFEKSLSVLILYARLVSVCLTFLCTEKLFSILENINMKGHYLLMFVFVCTCMCVCNMIWIIGSWHVFCNITEHPSLRCINMTLNFQYTLLVIRKCPRTDIYSLLSFLADSKLRINKYSFILKSCGK